MKDEDTNKTEQEGKEIPETRSKLVDDAKETATRLEEANKKQEELLERQEQLYARQALGGQSTAGQAPEKPKELTDQELTEKFLNGEIELL